MIFKFPGKSILLIACLLWMSGTYAQTPKNDFFSRVRHRWPFNSKQAHHGLIATPLIYYTPETRLALGISTIFYFRFTHKDTSFRPSVVHPFFAYTQNHQAFVESPFQLFFKQEKYYVYGEVAFYKYPYKFFGIGNEVPSEREALYNALYPSCSLSVLRKVLPRVYAGIRYNFDYYTIRFQDTSNALYKDTFTGKKGGLNNGIGLQLLYDSRDNIFSSHKGWYIAFMSVFDSRKITRSSYNYQWFTFDLRKFIPYRNNVFAFQFYTNFIGGDPPFYQMALLGGDHIMRGYYEGRYRDKNYTAGQAEYRSPLYKDRIGIALFAAAGTIYHNFRQFDLHYLRSGLGGGLRFRFNRKEKIHFRIDVAHGNTWNYYFVLSEAF